MARPAGQAGEHRGKPGGVCGRIVAVSGRRARRRGPGGAHRFGLGNFDVWTVNLRRGVSQRLTSDAAREASPIWSPAGNLIVFNQSGDHLGAAASLFTVPSDGAGDGKLLSRSDLPATPTNWSRDKRFILFHTGSPTSADIWLLAMDGNRQPMPLIQTKFSEGQAHFSPNMRWIAYASNLSGRSEVYVRPFNAAAPAAPAAAKQVSNGGGQAPRWRRDGELFYSRSDGWIMSVDIPAADPSRAGAPTPLFAPGGQWDVTADGKRFLVAMPLAEAGLSPITVVLHWKARGRQ